MSHNPESASAVNPETIGRTGDHLLIGSYSFSTGTIPSEVGQAIQMCNKRIYDGMTFNVDAVTFVIANPDKFDLSRTNPVLYDPIINGHTDAIVEIVAVTGLPGYLTHLKSPHQITYADIRFDLFCNALNNTIADSLSILLSDSPELFIKQDFSGLFIATVFNGYADDIRQKLGLRNPKINVDANGIVTYDYSNETAVNGISRRVVAPHCIQAKSA
jgi:hypothetical protein